MTPTIRVALLSLWLGAALFFSAVVAPSVFGVLRGFDLASSGEIAGAIVNRTLRVINISGFIVGLVLLLLTIWRRNERRLSLFLNLSALSLMSIAAAVGHWIVAARLAALRLAMVVPIDEVNLNDPRRVEFSKLHGYSVTLLSIAMLAAIAGIIFSSAMRVHRSERSEIKK